LTYLIRSSDQSNNRDLIQYLQKASDDMSEIKQRIMNVPDDREPLQSAEALATLSTIETNLIGIPSKIQLQQSTPYQPQLGSQKYALGLQYAKEQELYESQAQFGSPSQYAAPQYTPAPQYADPRYAEAPQYADPQYEAAPQYADPQYAAAPQYADPQYAAPQYGAVSQYAAPQYAAASQYTVPSQYKSPQPLRTQQYQQEQQKYQEEQKLRLIQNEAFMESQRKLQQDYQAYLDGMRSQTQQPLQIPQTYDQTTLTPPPAQERKLVAGLGNDNKPMTPFFKVKAPF